MQFQSITNVEIYLSHIFILQTWRVYDFLALWWSQKYSLQINIWTLKEEKKILPGEGKT